jgi:hypothetical protein
MAARMLTPGTRPPARGSTSSAGPDKRRFRVYAIVGLIVLGVGTLLGYLAAAGATGSGAERSQAAADPVRVASRPATPSEAAGAAKVTPKLGLGLKVTLKTRISRHAILTNKNTGDFVGLTCPRSYTAVSGGAVTGFINLLISHSAPIKPTGRQRYTPRTWWVAVTNVPIDPDAEDPLPWHPVVNCVNKFKIGS